MGHNRISANSRLISSNIILRGEICRGKVLTDDTRVQATITTLCVSSPPMAYDQPNADRSWLPSQLLDTGHLSGWAPVGGPHPHVGWPLHARRCRICCHRCGGAGTPVRHGHACSHQSRAVRPILHPRAEASAPPSACGRGAARGPPRTSTIQAPHVCLRKSAPIPRLLFKGSG